MTRNTRRLVWILRLALLGILLVLPSSATAQTGGTADLAVTVTASPNPVVLGQTLQYVVVVTNKGPDALTGSGAVSSLTFSSNVTITSGPCQSVIFSNLCQFSTGPLGSGNSTGYQINVTPLVVGALTGHAQIFTGNLPGPDPDLSNNTDSVTTTIQPNLPPVALAGPDQKLGIPALGLAVFTLDGSASSDPEGGSLTHQWRDHNGNVAGNSATLVLLRAGGTYTFTLTVSDGLSSASDSVKVTIQVDSTAPLVIAPGDIGVSKTESGGARGVDSPELAAFLVSGFGVDDLDRTLIQMPPQVAGADVDNNTLFPIGLTVVTFRFRDSSGNVGAATANLRVVDLQSGDLFVGTNAIINIFQQVVEPEGIRRVRSGAIEPWCLGALGGDPRYFQTPHSVLMDSQGRVVFLAAFGIPGFAYAGAGLFRCDSQGVTPELLGAFPFSQPISHPNATFPFPGNVFAAVNRLHLTRQRSILIDDNTNNGLPRIVTEDAYLFLAGRWNLGTQTAESLKTVRYRVSSDVWEDGPPVVQKLGLPHLQILPDVATKGDMTYSTGGGEFGRFKEPLRVEITAQFGSVTAGATLSLFGGYHQVPNSALPVVIVDDLNVPNVDSGCPAPFPPPPFPVSTLMPGFGFSSIDFNLLAFDKGKLVVQANTPALFLTDISEVLLDDDPRNDPHFTNPFGGCSLLWPLLELKSMATPFFAGPGGLVNQVNVMATAPQGLVGTQSFTGNILRIVDSPAPVLPVIATGLSLPIGIAAWPPSASSGSGAVVIIRIDSPVDVLLTDANGRRLGVDASGQPVNDFGSDGFDSGAGTHPRFYAIQTPAPGNYTVQSIGTGTGPFTVHVYSVDLDKPVGEHILQSGNASPGSAGKHDFTLDATGALTYSNQAPVANAGGDQTVNADASGNATVALDGSLSSDPDGDPLSFIWSGPFGSLTGPQVNAPLPVGIHSLTLTVDDGKGGFADATVVITVNAVTPPADTTPPVLTLPGNLIAEATSAAGAAVSYSATANDAVDGPITPICAPASGSTFPLGQTTVNCTATDAANNAASGSFNVTVQDTLPPALAAKANLTVPATGPGGAAVNYTSPAATDAADANPAVLCLPASGSNFALGTATVNCTATDFSGNSAQSFFNVTVIVGTPRIAGTVAGKGRDAAGNYFVDVRLTNTGTGNARNLRITQLPLRTLSGTGTASYNTALSPPLPLTIGNLDVAASATLRFYLNLPATVTRFSITQSGPVQDVVGTNYAYSTAQSVVP